MAAAYGDRTNLGQGLVLEVVSEALDVDLVVYPHLYTTGPGQPKELKRIRLPRATVDANLIPALGAGVLFGLKSDIGQGLVVDRTSADGDICISIYRDLYTTSGRGEPALLKQVTISETTAATFASALALPPFGGHATLTDGLIAYWPFNDGASPWVGLDAAGDPAVSMSGGATTTGLLGSAVRTTGGSNISATTGAFALTSDMSFSGWVYAEGSNAGPFAFSGNNPSPTWSTGMGIGYSLTAMISNTSGGFVQANGSVPGLEQWFHLVTMVDISEKKITLVVNNGTPDVSSALTGTIRTGDTTMYMCGSDDPFRLDEAGFWNRLLTVGEITDLYNGGAGLAY